MNRLERETLNVVEGCERRIRNRETHQAYADGLLIQSYIFGINPRVLPMEDRLLVEWAHVNARLRNRGYEGVDKYTWMEVVNSRRKVPRKLQYTGVRRNGVTKTN